MPTCDECITAGGIAAKLNDTPQDIKGKPPLGNDYYTTKGWVDETKADRNGNPTEKFKVADGEEDDEAVNVGQSPFANKSLVNVIGSRNKDTTYTNTSNYYRYVIVSVYSSGSNGVYKAKINDTPFYFGDGNSKPYCTIAVLVPPGETYSIGDASVNTETTIIEWWETE